MSDYVISATLRVKDEMSGKVKGAKKELSGIKAAAGDASLGLNSMDSAMKQAGRSGMELARQTGGLKRQLEGIRGTYAPTIGLKDNATGRLSGIREKLQGISSKAYTATVNIRERFFGGGKGGGGVLSGLAGGALMNTPVQMMGAAGIGLGVFDTVKTYMDFEAQMKRVQAISGASAGDFAVLTDKAKEMGATTQFSATESGKALEYMAMAGWKTEEMTAGISGIMSLAAASGEDLGRVSDIVTDALTAFGLKAEDAGHFSDVLAQASSNSNTNVGLMGMTFKYVAPLAGALKYSVEDVGTAIGLMANAGIKGEQAGTSLRAVLTRLAKPTDGALASMEKLGISIKNSDGSVKPFRQTLKDLRTAFAGLSDAEKTEHAANIAGQEAMSGLLAIVNESEENFEKLTTAIDNSAGASERMAAIANDNLKGDLKSLASVWESFQLELMSGTGGEGLRSFVQGIRDDVAKLKGYISDGFDISDIGRSAMDVVVQLKNKFIELDGVGSLLAGGALAGGLYKIISLSKKAIEGIKGLGGKGKPGAPGESAVGEMVVNAGTVIVNGKSVSGGAPGSPSPGKVPPGAPVPKGGGFLRGAGKLFAGLAIADAALGIYEAYSQNEEESRIAAQVDDADYSAQVQKYNDDRMGGAVGSGVGALAGGLAGAKVGAAAGGAIGSAFGVIGAAPGAAIGGIIGGIGGAFGGSELGAYIGTQARAWKEAAIASWGEFPEDMHENVWAPAEDGANSALGTIADDSADAREKTCIQWRGLVPWFREDVWPQFNEAHEEAGKLLVDSFANALASAKSHWDSAAGWFESSVWTPIEDGARALKGSIVSAFEGALASAKGVWSGAAGWFETSVVAPIKSKFSSLSEWGSSVGSRAADYLGIGHNAGGTSYWHGGLTEINEHGGEIIDLPSGARVYPHATTMSMLRESIGSGGGTTSAAPVVNISGNRFIVREEADIDRIAHALAQLMATNGANMNYAGGAI